MKTLKNASASSAVTDSFSAEFINSCKNTITLADLSKMDQGELKN